MKYNRFEKYKILFYADKLEQIARGEICYPESMVVYPTYLCNYKCPHCIMQVERKGKNSMTPELLKKVVDDAIRLDLKSVIFSGGGEPLVNKYTMPTISAIHDAGIPVGLNTNGYLLGDASKIDFLRVSVDAGTKETYQKVHGVDGFDVITKNILSIHENKIELGLAFLIGPNNWQEIIPFCEWAQQFNYDFIHIRPAWLDGDYLEGGDKLLSIMPNVLKIKETVEREFRSVFFRVDKFDGYWTPRLYEKCRATPIMAVLCPDGKFAVCQDNFIKFGDYYNKSFEECWFSDEHRRAIESIELSKCPRCVESGYNEIIENCVMCNSLRKELL